MMDDSQREVAKYELGIKSSSEIFFESDFFFVCDGEETRAGNTSPAPPT